MTLRLALAVLLTMSIKLASGQDFRDYELGPLALDDFLGEPLDIDSLSGQLFFEYETEIVKTQVDGVNYEETLWKAGINIQESWINRRMMPELALDYFQILYDIEHLHILRTNRLNNTGEAMAGQKISKYRQNADIQIEKYALESAGGSRPDIIAKWRQRLSQSIADEEARQVERPQRASIDYISAMDMAIGVGYNLQTGAIADHFGSGIGMSFSLGYSHRHWRFGIDGVLGFNNNNQTLADAPFWEEDINITAFQLLFGIGRQIDVGNIIVQPHLGTSMSNIRISEEDYDGVYEDITDVQWGLGAGLIVDIPLSRSIGRQYGMYYTTNQGYQSHGLRLSLLTTTPLTFYERYDGQFWNIGLGYYFSFGGVSQKLTVR